LVAAFFFEAFFAVFLLVVFFAAAMEMAPPCVASFVSVRRTLRDAECGACKMVPPKQLKQPTLKPVVCVMCLDFLN
jgi:hypothetical protein